MPFPPSSRPRVGGTCPLLGSGDMARSKSEQPLGALPGVSYVMPVLNEAGYLEDAVASVLAQTYAGERELILALGPSTDSTPQIVARLIEAAPHIRLVENPGMDIPIGLNLAIRAARHPVIVRIDAHTEIDPDYTRRGIETMLRTGAASLGGIMAAKGRSTFQSAVARAYNSRFGLGGGAYHGSAVEGPAESAYMGIMRKEALVSVGLFDESLRRGEDWELNHRLRGDGHLVWLDPALSVSYWPRNSPGKLARQFLSTGIWRGELVRRLGGRNPWRFFAPPILLASLVLSVVVAVLQITGVVNGLPSVVLSLVYLGPLLYLLLLVSIAATASGGRSLADRASLVVALAIMHLSWGAGFAVGVLRGARDAADTSSTES